MSSGGSDVRDVHVVVVTDRFTDDLAALLDHHGFRVDAIFPADAPSTAIVSAHGVRLRLEASATPAPVTLHLLTDDRTGSSTLPGGSTIAFHPFTTTYELPANTPSLVVVHDGGEAGVGRAGMQYRDLLPDRWGGRFVASHISIPDGGPVPDYVHFHKVRFQMIFVKSGWVRLVYEDQGDPFVMVAGDCVLQPPEIRHRVLEASDGIEVIEIGVPAEHITEIDHAMTLPTPHLRPDREWQGQRFVHNVGAAGVFVPFRLPGFVARDTTICANTQGVASVMVARPDGGVPEWTRHDADILVTYVMQGAMTLEGEGKAPFRLSPGDAFVIPPGLATRYGDATPDLELLEVSLPGRFATTRA